MVGMDDDHRFIVLTETKFSQQGAVSVHNGGVGKDKKRKKKRLVFKFAPAAWVDETRDVGGDFETRATADPVTRKSFG
jgi:hypothetical protein